MPAPSLGPSRHSHSGRSSAATRPTRRSLRAKPWPSLRDQRIVGRWLRLTRCSPGRSSRAGGAAEAAELLWRDVRRTMDGMAGRFWTMESMVAARYLEASERQDPRTDDGRSFDDAVALALDIGETEFPV